MSNTWEELYQSNQTGWDRGEVSNNLFYWIEAGMLEPCRILVPGCGNGYEVMTLTEKGFDVVAIDIAPTAVSHLKSTLLEAGLKAEVIEADFFSWQPDKPFDAVYEQTSLCALPPSEWERYEACLYNWLKLKGKLLAQFMQTGAEGGPPFHCEISVMEDLFSTQKWQWSGEYDSGITHSVGKRERLFLLEKV